ncbi:MAG: hypothetical protein ACN2B6_04335 [Rickettsiales bacterium]
MTKTRKDYRGIAEGLIDGSVTSVHLEDVNRIFKKLGFYDTEKQAKHDIGNRFKGNGAGRSYAHQELGSGAEYVVIPHHQIINAGDEYYFRHIVDSLTKLKDADPRAFDALGEDKFGLEIIERIGVKRKPIERDIPAVDAMRALRAIGFERDSSTGSSFIHPDIPGFSMLVRNDIPVSEGRIRNAWKRVQEISGKQDMGTPNGNNGFSHVARLSGEEDSQLGQAI